jgi:hypothetical protein
VSVKHVLLLAVVAALLVAGCGGDSADEATTPVKVYFLRDGTVWPVAREVAESDTIEAATEALLDGPTEEERELGFTTEASGAPVSELSRAGLAQLVYTASQFSPDGSAELDGVDHARGDFEEQTPSVLVESPLPFEDVTSPVTATGTANTFEANFQYELLDSDGNVVDESFVTATSGTGTRGTFEFTTADVDEFATLVVFETSAEDGSRIREVGIPLTQAS